MICLSRNCEPWVHCCWCIIHLRSIEGSLMYIHVIEHYLLSTRDQGFQELWQEALTSCWLWISVTSWAPWKWKSLSPVWLFATPLTIQSMEVSRVEYWSILQNTEDFPNPGIEPRSPALWADSLPAEPPGKPKNTGVGRLSLLQSIFLT